eukprot:TRINITY_DN31810_c0_g1_i1.p1 TRINITY_DN31810_c0_g1~~TRINITY_DN31810_c0_g1_i1.p1  ORF type:complete len:312 (-),score=60.18 TRINITY_DN31810_c0_g1_i1:97-1002(-)
MAGTTASTSSKAWRLVSRGGAVLGLGLAGHEIYHLWHEATIHGLVQLDDRVQLVLGLPGELLAERAERERRMKQVMSSGQQRAAAIIAAQGNGSGATSPANIAALGELRQQLVEEANQVLHPGFTSEDLRLRRKMYGNVKWNDEAMQIIQRYSPLVEIGAGEGQWQSELLRRGADVTAYDDYSSPSRFSKDEGPSKKRSATSNHAPGANVLKADAGEALKRSRGRNLLLVYPPPGQMAATCLAHYAGDVLLYVGEGRGGVNGSDAFFDALATTWVLEETLALDPLPGSYEKLYVLRRFKEE